MRLTRIYTDIFHNCISKIYVTQTSRIIYLKRPPSMICISIVSVQNKSDHIWSETSNEESSTLALLCVSCFVLSNLIVEIERRVLKIIVTVHGRNSLNWDGVGKTHSSVALTMPDVQPILLNGGSGVRRRIRATGWWCSSCHAKSLQVCIWTCPTLGFVSKRVQVFNHVIVVSCIFIISVLRSAHPARFLRWFSPNACPTPSASTPTKKSFIQPSLKRVRMDVMRQECDEVFTIGWMSKLPWASTAPVPLLRRHTPGVPLDGGTLADGTKIRHYHGGMSTRSHLVQM